MKYLKKSIYQLMVLQVMSMFTSWFMVKSVVSRVGIEFVALLGCINILLSLVPSIFDWGLSTGTVVNLAPHWKQAGFKGEVARSHTMYWINIIAAAVLLLLTLPWLLQLFKIESILQDYRIIAILGLTLAVYILRYYFSFILRAADSIFFVNLIVALSVIIRNLFLGTSRLSTDYLVLVFCALLLAEVFVLALFARWELGFFPGFTRITKADVQKYVLDFKTVYLKNMLEVFQLNLDKVFLGALMPTSQFAIYTTVSNHTRSVAAVGNNVSYVVLPHFSRSNKEDGQSDLLSLSRLNGLLVVPLAILFLLITPEVYRIIFAENWNTNALIALYLLCFAIYLSQAPTVLVTYLVAQRHARIALVSSVTALLISLPMTYVFTLQLGAIGAGVALCAFFASYYLLLLKLGSAHVGVTHSMKLLRFFISSILVLIATSLLHLFYLNELFHKFAMSVLSMVRS